jgi:hypothetical protein
VRATIVSICVLGLALGLAGPAAAEESADSRALRERAREYWKLRIARDPKLYQFYAPPEKGGPTYFYEVSDYRAVQYTDFEITGVEVDGDQGRVRVRAHHVLVGEKIRQLPDEYRWVDLTREWSKVGGVWYQKPRKPGLSVAEKFRQRRQSRKGAEAGAGRQAPAPTEEASDRN